MRRFESWKTVSGATMLALVCSMMAGCATSNPATPQKSISQTTRLGAAGSSLMDQNDSARGRAVALARRAGCENATLSPGSNVPVLRQPSVAEACWIDYNGSSTTPKGIRVIVYVLLNTSMASLQAGLDNVKLYIASRSAAVPFSAVLEGRDFLVRLIYNKEAEPSEKVIAKMLNAKVAYTNVGGLTK